ncbi:MAG: hypothetical protein KDE27_24485, partial [Planctomycetes bacterium]|nr:hypothetical protein [Planctomycetota bacterium]
PERPEAWREAARLMRERELWSAAAENAKQGLMHVEDPTLRQEWALALIGEGKLDEAILQLEAYLRVRSEDEDTKKILANVLVGRAYSRLQAGRSHAEVLRIVDQALALNPNEHKAHLVLGRIAREQRRFADAVEHLETAHRLMPEVEDARTLLADSLRDLGMEHYLKNEDVAAGDAWLRFRAVAPPSVDTDGVDVLVQALWRRHEQRGVDRLQQQDHAGALAEFRRCELLDSDTRAISWPYALALRHELAPEPEPENLAKLEELAREAVAWQQEHAADSGQQTCLLLETLTRRGEAGAAAELARRWLAAEPGDAEPPVVAAIRRYADG